LPCIPINFAKTPSLIREAPGQFVFLDVAAANRKPSSGRRSTKQKNYFSVKRIIGLSALVVVALLPLYYPYAEKSLSSAYRWLKDVGRNPNYPVYKSYNIHIPVKYAIHGIDVSSYQGLIDWEKVKRMRQDSVHISFAYLKATEGILITDPYFLHNRRLCNKVGMVNGAYHFFRPRASGKLQARFFLANVDIQKGDLPPVVDVEVLDGVSPEKMREELDDFLKAVSLKTKTKPIIYSGLKFYYDNLSGYYNDYHFWLSNFDHPGLAVSAGTTWSFWQHSNHARVSGILHGVDFDAFRGDSLTFREMLVK
jgi:lysozyme